MKTKLLLGLLLLAAGAAFVFGQRTFGPSGGSSTITSSNVFQFNTNHFQVTSATNVNLAAGLTATNMSLVQQGSGSPNLLIQGGAADGNSYLTMQYPGGVFFDVNSNRNVGIGMASVGGYGLTVTGGEICTNTATGAWAFYTNGQWIVMQTNVLLGAFVATNQAAATVGVQSPSFMELDGNGWKTAATAASQPVRWLMYNLPVQGSANPSGIFAFSNQINGGSWTAPMTLSSAGRMTLLENMIVGPAAAVFSSSGALSVYGSASSDLNLGANQANQVWTLKSSTGHLLPGGDGSQDLGSSSLRVRDLNLYRNLVIGSTASAQTILSNNNGFTYIFPSNAAPALTINGGNGFVGLNTNSPFTPFHIYNDTVNAQFRFESLTHEVGLRLRNSQADWLLFADDSSLNDMPATNSLGFYNYSTAAMRMTLLGTGQLGIGTTTPASLLDIAGTQNSYLLRVNTNVLVVTNAAVGVNTNRPGYALDVIGDTYLHGLLNAGYSGDVTFGQGLMINNGYYYGFSSSSLVRSPANGQLSMRNSAENNFTLLNWGGQTPAFPAIGRTNGDLLVFGGDGLFGGGSTNRLRVATAGTAITTVGGTISVTTTTVANAGTAQTNLMTYSVPANLLTNNGDRIEFKASGRFAANTDAKELLVILGSETVFDTTSQIVNVASGSWVLKGEIIRTGNTAQTAWVEYDGAGLSLFTDTSAVTLAQTNGIATTFAIAATAGGSGDVTNRTLTISYFPAP